MYGNTPGDETDLLDCAHGDLVTRRYRQRPVRSVVRLHVHVEAATELGERSCLLGDYAHNWEGMNWLRRLLLQSAVDRIEDAHGRISRAFFLLCRTQRRIVISATRVLPPLVGREYTRFFPSPGQLSFICRIDTIHSANKPEADFYRLGTPLASRTVG